MKKVIMRFIERLFLILEVLINLTIFIGGPIIAYLAFADGDYASGTIYTILIGLVGYIDYHDERVRVQSMALFFNLVILWEGAKHRYKHRRK